ncbi:hypothetical protein QQX09_07230 [Demequina sp. SYSU T00192]|uniref:Uncharacterized protein n=1 Tax=Demequina litoralis TaxID=3051660 RepID=A0ABT8G933_9MICO|nr:hypothetical protein [Demequina sp. SYSU T00192]MDN4475643.1 hypothetical protein [Demequina sp. SYSU T00192]
MTETSDILDQLRATADEVLASVGRDGIPTHDVIERLEALALRAHQAGHRVGEITIAARLSYQHVCALWARCHANRNAHPMAAKYGGSISAEWVSRSQVARAKPPAESRRATAHAEGFAHAT